MGLIHDRRSSADRARDVRLALQQIAVTAKALERCLDERVVPNLQITTEILCGAADAMRAIQHASVVLSGQRQRSSQARRASRRRLCRSCPMRGDTPRGRSRLENPR